MFVSLVIAVVFAIYHGYNALGYYRKVEDGYGLRRDTIVSTKVLSIEFSKETYNDEIVRKGIEQSYNFESTYLINYIKFIQLIKCCTFVGVDYEFTVLIKYNKGIFGRESKVALLQHFVCKDHVITVKGIEPVALKSL